MSDDFLIGEQKISFKEIKDRNKKSLAKHFELLEIKDVMVKAKLQNLFNQLSNDNRALIEALETK